MSTLADWKTFSDIAKNAFEVFAVFGGLFALRKWLAERNDRATDILLKLEQQFQKDNLEKGRLYLEDDRQCKLIRPQLELLASNAGNEKIKLGRASGINHQNARSTQKEALDDFGTLDGLLRFYVVLCGVRQADQVPEHSLSTCFRYWLCHYYIPNRVEFRSYVDAHYPTLRKWLTEDAGRKRKKRFFRPSDFGWPDPGCG